eukprot:3024606-Rhodomonas_salina.1
MARTRFLFFMMMTAQIVLSQIILDNGQGRVDTGQILFTWGRNNAAQLGVVTCAKDKLLPTWQCEPDTNDRHVPTAVPWKKEKSYIHGGTAGLPHELSKCTKSAPDGTESPAGFSAEYNQVFTLVFQVSLPLCCREIKYERSYWQPPFILYDREQLFRI